MVETSIDPTTDPQNPPACGVENRRFWGRPQAPSPPMPIVRSRAVSPPIVAGRGPGRGPSVTGGTPVNVTHPPINVTRALVSVST